MFSSKWWICIIPNYINYAICQICIIRVKTSFIACLNFRRHMCPLGDIYYLWETYILIQSLGDIDNHTTFFWDTMLLCFIILQMFKMVMQLERRNRGIEEMDYLYSSGIKIRFSSIHPTPFVQDICFYKNPSCP